MNLKEYIQEAVKTESKIEHVKVNPDLIVNILYLFNAAGRMLDQVKKHVFYGKDYSVENFSVDYTSCITALQALTLIQVNGSSEDMKEEDHKQIDSRVFHAIMGIATEATELTEALYKVLITEGLKPDYINIREENGDLNWYQAILYDAMRELGIEGTWEDDLQKNIDKLQKKRYKGGTFTQEEALYRNIDDEISVYKEMKELEELLESEETEDSSGKS